MIVEFEIGNMEKVIKIILYVIYLINLFQKFNECSDKVNFVNKDYGS